MKFTVVEGKFDGELVMKDPQQRIDITLDIKNGAIVKYLGDIQGVFKYDLNFTDNLANGTMEVQKDFKLATIDCVSDPSGPSCFINGILEGVEYFYDDARGSWKEEKVQKLLDKGTKIEVYLGEVDKIIDASKAKEFFKNFATVYYIKQKGHLL